MAKKDKDSFLKGAYVTQTHGYLDVFPKREMWKQIAEEFKGDFKIAHNSSNELEIHKLIIQYKKWVINISESDTRPLKFEIEFNSVMDYSLVLGWEDSIEKLLKKLGKREIEVGNKEFDDHYLIKSNDADKTINLFTSEIIDLMLKHNVYSISYATSRKKQKANLISAISRTIDDKQTIMDLVQLHFYLIDSLERLHLIS